MKHCPKCNAAVGEEDRFCESCGQALDIAAAQPATAPEPAGAPDSQARAAPVPVLPTAPDANKKVTPAAWIGTGVLILIVITFAWWSLRTPSPGPAQSQTQPQSGQIASVSPAQTPPVEISVRPPSATPAPRGPELFRHDFETATPIVTPLFGSGIMTVTNLNGEGQMIGRSAGILPAMFGKFFLNDFILESDMRCKTVPAGARYGLMFRAADVRNGAIAAYYTVLLDSNKNSVAMSCWSDSQWVMNVEAPLTSGMLVPGLPNRLSVEVVGNQFSVFINDTFVAKFSDTTLVDGRIGLCLASESNEPFAVYFDNFRIFLTPKEGISDAGEGRKMDVQASVSMGAEWHKIRER